MCPTREGKKFFKLKILVYYEPKKKNTLVDEYELNEKTTILFMKTEQSEKCRYGCHYFG